MLHLVSVDLQLSTVATQKDLMLIVPSVCEPLRWGVLPGAVELSVVSSVEQQTGPEVYESDGPSAGLDHHVLVLDVAVDDSHLVTLADPL